MSRLTLRRSLAALAITLSALTVAHAARGQGVQTLDIRGHAQVLHVYGSRGGPPVIVASGDGGWIHLAPHVAETLAAKGFYVIGFDVKAYLEAFTSDRGTLQPDDVTRDFKMLVDVAARGSTRRPVLVGVSEGAGLSVLAVTDARTNAAVDGVVALGLPNVNELGWRWKDSVIYVTHATPHEPTFSTAAVVSRVSPAPLAMIQSTHDEFVPATDTDRILDAAREPKRLWNVAAMDHRFSGNVAEFDRRLLDAMDWVHGTRGH